jgi:AcrR family transcriptional regulator
MTSGDGVEEARRADGTRRRIMDAAAELYAEFGYGNVSLSDVVRRSGVSRGAFGHHFPTKEALADALSRYSYTELAKKILSEVSESGSVLSNLIGGSFAQQALMLRDNKVRVGVQLAQATEQVSDVRPADFGPNLASYFQTAIAEAVAAGDFYRHIDGRKLGYVLWCGIVANNMVAHMADMDPIEGLAVIWEVHLRGALSATSLGYYQQVLRRVADQYSTKGPPDPTG